MTFGWKNYLILAKALANSPVCSGDENLKDEEVQANYRAALSRAYYGVFKVTYNYLRDVEKDFGLMMPVLQKQGQSFTREEVEKVNRETKSIHEYVLKKLESDTRDNRKNNLRRGLRKILRELKERRTEADYHDQHVYDHRTIKLVMSNADEAMRYAQQLLN